MLIMKRFYTAMSLVAVLLYMASLSLATTSASNFTDLSALLAFSPRSKPTPTMFWGVTGLNLQASAIGLGSPVAIEDNE